MLKYVDHKIIQRKNMSSSNPFSHMKDYAISGLSKPHILLIVTILIATYAITVFGLFIVGLSISELYLVQTAVWIITFTLELLFYALIFYTVSWYLLKIDKFRNSKLVQTLKSWWDSKQNLKNKIHEWSDTTASKFENLKDGSESVANKGVRATKDVLNNVALFDNSKENKPDL